MTHAETARANAISFEIKKDGLQQRQSGDWVLRVTVQAIDMHQRIVNAPMGARFACVLVEINDDETAVNHKAEDRDKWRALGPTRQAGIRCKEPAFWAYLKEMHFPDVQNEHMAACVVRDHCGVGSRRDLERIGNADARLRWYALDLGFQAWRVKENA